MNRVRIAIVGCGYVADFYLATLPNHPFLQLTGAYDRDLRRQREFTGYHQVDGYGSLPDLLADPAVELVVNLTNPSSHAEVTRLALLAGKHVYVEKPLAMTLPEARALVDLAAGRGLLLGSAPCNLLGETAQTLWRALREGVIGTPRLAYAELDAGPIPRLPFETWVSASGAPWPYLDEFRTGCVIEHAGYYLTWLTAFFGPAVEVTAYAAAVVPNPYLEGAAPDFATACLRFGGGVVARVTSGIIAPGDHSLRIVGDEGVLTVTDCGDYESPVTLTRAAGEAPVPLVRSRGPLHGYDDVHRMDFACGVADLARAATGETPSHLPVEHALHVLELTLTMAEATGGTVMRPSTTFAPFPPMPWAGE
ncbi:Gfo/Idh/MocA family oxidoreductase [Acrocarpospora macrocephala]|uniref:Oxidoreductase n=1 Tax=Acrocarpospora macrocephala TaxID=150177 RepID=A0A5M3X1P6_9ACTN|nr:Gfo/Idh/MocA family oxidoreductase [Acrocarpospora macrocephala]GES12228.1 oxidoreductase [Acrocarpospora macrocephala]